MQATVQADLLSGYVQPIGDEPDGTQWTGFQSVKSENAGYIEIIRERSQTSSHVYRLAGVKNATLTLEPIIGYGKQQQIKVDGDGNAVFELDEPLSYALYKYSI